MKEYRIEYTKKADKNLKKIKAKTRFKIFDAIYDISQGNTQNKDIKKLKNEDDMYRLRMGQYRILYTYMFLELVVLVIDVDVRGNVYKK